MFSQIGQGEVGKNFSLPGEREKDRFFFSSLLRLWSTATAAHVVVVVVVLVVGEPLSAI